MGSVPLGKGADGDSGREAAASLSSSRNDGEAVALLLALIGGRLCGSGLLGEAGVCAMSPEWLGIGGGPDPGAALPSAESCKRSTFPSAHHVPQLVKDRACSVPDSWVHADMKAKYHSMTRYSA